MPFPSGVNEISIYRRLCTPLGLHFAIMRKLNSNLPLIMPAVVRVIIFTDFTILQRKIIEYCI